MVGPKEKSGEEDGGGDHCVLLFGGTFDKTTFSSPLIWESGSTSEKGVNLGCVAPPKLCWLLNGDDE